MRNREKDEIEMGKKRRKMLTVGFRLFCKKSIETASMTDISQASKLAYKTMFRYFGTKTAFVIAIAAKKLQEYSVHVDKMYRARGGASMTAAEELEFFLDCSIDLYRNHRDVLLFLRNFETYIRHENVPKDDLRVYNSIVDRFARKFHAVYQKAEKDGTLKLGMPETEFFPAIMYIMLSAAGKFAEGLVYPPEREKDMTGELTLLKNMILRAYKN